MTCHGAHSTADAHEKLGALQRALDRVDTG